MKKRPELPRFPAKKPAAAEKHLVLRALSIPRRGAGFRNFGKPVNEKHVHPRDTTQVYGVGDTGLEQPQETSGKTALSEIGGTESGTVGADYGFQDRRLEAIIDAWPSLPEAVKEDIVAMVRAAGGVTAG